MYVLHATDQAELRERSALFEKHFEPLLWQLEEAVWSGSVSPAIPEISQYLQVCRWPFRRLEYAFALDALLGRLAPGDRYLDAGSGVTPLGHIFAARGAVAAACDGDERVVAALQRLDLAHIYGSAVTYRVEDLTTMAYASETFDAVSCISVLEHIPAPHDQRALRELLRVLKPGGVLVATVDYTPASYDPSRRMGYLLDRALRLARQGHLVEIGRGVVRKLQAAQAVRQSGARQPRSANQCFDVSHLKQDIAPLLEGMELPSGIPHTADLHALTADDAQRFWDLEPGLYHNQGQRAVLPVGFTVQKAAATAVAA